MMIITYHVATQPKLRKYSYSYVDIDTYAINQLHCSYSYVGMYVANHRLYMWFIFLSLVHCHYRSQYTQRKLTVHFPSVNCAYEFQCYQLIITISSNLICFYQYIASQLCYVAVFLNFTYYTKYQLASYMYSRIRIVVYNVVKAIL